MSTNASPTLVGWFCLLKILPCLRWCKVKQRNLSKRVAPNLIASLLSKCFKQIYAGCMPGRGGAGQHLQLWHCWYDVILQGASQGPNLKSGESPTPLRLICCNIFNALPAYVPVMHKSTAHPSPTRGPSLLAVSVWCPKTLVNSTVWLTIHSPSTSHH